MLLLDVLWHVWQCLIRKSSTHAQRCPTWKVAGRGSLDRGDGGKTFEPGPHRVVAELPGILTSPPETPETPYHVYNTLLTGPATNTMSRHRKKYEDPHYPWVVTQTVSLTPYPPESLHNYCQKVPYPIDVCCGDQTRWPMHDSTNSGNTNTCMICVIADFEVNVACEVSFGENLRVRSCIHDQMSYDK